MNRDELIRAVSAAGGSTYLESSQFLDAVLPLIEADLRQRLAAEIEAQDAAEKGSDTWWDIRHGAFAKAASIVRGATADTDPAGGDEGDA